MKRGLWIAATFLVAAIGFWAWQAGNPAAPDRPDGAIDRVPGAGSEVGTAVESGGSLAVNEASRQAEAERVVAILVTMAGKPVPGANIRVLVVDDDLMETVSRGGEPGGEVLATAMKLTADDHGQATIVLPREPHVVAAFAPGATPCGMLLESDTESLAFELTPEEVARGTVHHADGRPAAGVEVRGGIELRRRQEMDYLGADLPVEYVATLFWTVSTVVGAEGEFELHGLPTGNCWIEAGAPGWSTVREDPVWMPQDQKLAFTLYRGAAVEGYVLDEASKLPIPGSRVQAGAAEKEYRRVLGYGCTRTDGTGHYRLDGIRADLGGVQVLASAPGYGSKVVRLPAVPAQTSLRQDVLLKPAAELRGRIVSSAGERPLRIAGVDVYQEPGGCFIGSYLTGDSGEFRAGELEEGGTYTLVAYHERHESVWIKDLTLPVDPFDVALEPRGVIQGVVTFDGQPVSGGGQARLLLEATTGHPIVDWRTEIDETGRFQFLNVPPASYILEAFVANFAPTRLHPVVVDPDSSDDVVHRIELVEGAALEGRVFDAVTGQGVPDVLIRCHDVRSHGDAAGALPIETTTAADGSYRIAHAPRERKVGLVIDHPNYASTMHTVLIPGGAAGFQADIPLTAGGNVRVSIREPGGVPVADMMARVIAPGCPALSGEASDGWVVIERVPPGRFTVAAQALASNDPSVRGLFFAREVTLEAGQDLDIVFSADDGSIVTGRLITEDPALLQSRPFTVYYRQDGSQQRFDGGSKVREDGTFRIFGVPPGPHSFWCTTMDMGPRMTVLREVDVVAGAVTVVEFSLGGASLSGLVADGDGKPIAGATIQVAEMESADLPSGMRPQSSTESGSDGTYELLGLQTGHYLCRLTAPRYGRIIEDVEIPPDDGSVSRDFVLEPEVVLAIQVFGPGGEVVSNARVFAAREGEPASEEVEAKVADVHGVHRVEGARGGSYEVRAEAAGLFPAWTRIRASYGELVELQLFLRARGDMEIRVKRLDGTPAAGVPIEVMSELGESALQWLGRGWIASEPTQLVTGDDGVCVLRGVPLGRYRVNAAGGSVWVRVEGGEPVACLVMGT